MAKIALYKSYELTFFAVFAMKSTLATTRIAIGDVETGGVVLAGVRGTRSRAKRR